MSNKLIYSGKAKDILATDIFVLASDPILPAKLDYTMKVYDDDNYM